MARVGAPERVAALAGLGPLIPVVMSIATALVVVGCAPSPPPRLAPPIPADQLDLGAFVAKPCDLLRPDRVTRQHLNAPGTVINDAVNNAGGPACRWNAADNTHPHLTAGADPSHDLEWLYQHRAEFGSFQPTSVSHYPAVNTTPGGRRPTDGTCTTRVGVANDSLLVVTADYSGQQSRFASNPCPDASGIAFEIITQLLGSG